MKYLLYSLLGLLLLGSGLFAQPQRGGMDPEALAERQTQRMTELLQLDEDLLPWVHEINLEYAQRMFELREDHQGDRAAMRSGMQQLRVEKDVALAGILTEEQMQILRDNPPPRPGGERPPRNRRPQN
ncbi:MAG: hypothetical protein D6722_22490 [Bacteroidetes bacterium]|nr:MAG: hypothetical protein D6722_22490 [Bacteroidota bacterium]